MVHQLTVPQQETQIYELTASKLSCANLTCVSHVGVTEVCRPIRLFDIDIQRIP